MQQLSLHALEPLLLRRQLVPLRDDERVLRKVRRTARRRVRPADAQLLEEKVLQASAERRQELVVDRHRDVVDDALQNTVSAAHSVRAARDGHTLYATLKYARISAMTCSSSSYTSGGRSFGKSGTSTLYPSAVSARTACCSYCARCSSSRLLRARFCPCAAWVSSEGCGVGSCQNGFGCCCGGWTGVCGADRAWVPVADARAAKARCPKADWVGAGWPNTVWVWAGASGDAGVPGAVAGAGVATFVGTPLDPSSVLRRFMAGWSGRASVLCATRALRYSERNFSFDTCR